MRRLAERWLQGIENRFTAAFGPRANPLYHLGALTIFFFWIALASGIYLFVFFETSVVGAFESVEALTHEQWYLGGVMRSLHRYSSDAAVLTMGLHLVREFIRDRYRGVRWFPWLTGVPLLWLVFILGITGYWLVWDMLAQYIAVATAELLDRLPIFTDPMARNFLLPESISDRLFTLLAFLHLLGLPLFLLFGVWLHVVRIARPRVNPPAALAAGSLAALVALAWIHPATSHDMADLARAPTVLRLDWFYLALYPLIDRMPLGAVWGVLGGATLLVAIAPWLPPKRRGGAARVDLANCNGCARCFTDCPYDAVTMQPRTDGQPFVQEAVVNAALCTGCGICVGACPTATPFRRTTGLKPGIDSAELPLAELRERLHAAAAALSGRRVIVFGCSAGTALEGLQDRETAAIRLPCIGMLPPSCIDYILARRLADGVFLTGCAEGNCRNRFGIDWACERIEGRRDPRLRRRVPRARIEACWAGPGGEARVARALAAFRRRLAPRQTPKQALARAVADAGSSPCR